MAKRKAEDKAADQALIEIEFLPDGSILFPDDVRLLDLARDLGGDRISAKIQQGSRTKFLKGERMCG